MAKTNSRSGSPAVEEEPAPVLDFFQTVSRYGYPDEKEEPKVQPWRAHWEGPQEPKDGKLIVACPKKCDYGTFSRWQRNTASTRSSTTGADLATGSNNLGGL